MTVTWHWAFEDSSEMQLHARRRGEEGTLCGANAQVRPVMRPPFFEARCEACEAARAGDEEEFPNHMLSANFLSRQKP